MNAIKKISAIKGLLTACSLLVVVSAWSQRPVKWSYVAKKISNTQYQVQLTAFIEKGWHVYSQKQPETAIAIPTTISFSRNPMVGLKGVIKEEGELQKIKDESLDIEAWQYAEKVSFVQLVELKKQVKTNITGTIEFQACTDEKCLPPATISFTVVLEP